MMIGSFACAGVDKEAGTAVDGRDGGQGVGGSEPGGVAARMERTNGGRRLRTGMGEEKHMNEDSIKEGVEQVSTVGVVG